MMAASVPGLLQKSVPPEGAESGGYWFEGGTVIASRACALRRDSVVFPGPERFNPGQWATPTKKWKDAFFAWSGGARGKSSP
jgi:cytochrome P450